MFTKIVQKQIELNDSIMSNWRDQDWELAILVEAAEAIDSTAWKWWKAGTDDIDNLKIEAIDLLHFMISNMLSSNDYSDDPGLLAVELNDEFTQAVNSQANKWLFAHLHARMPSKKLSAQH